LLAALRQPLSSAWRKLFNKIAPKTNNTRALQPGALTITSFA
jgi:hypothetical protein